MKKATLVTLAIIFMLVGCSTSRITSTWKARDIQPKKFNKILVLGLLPEKDRDLREQMEQHVLTNLQSNGFNAICACEEYGPKAFENMTEKAAIDTLFNSGIDAVLTVVLLDKKKERYYVPGHVTYSPYAMYHNNFWGYYITMYDRVYSPGYYTAETKYFWESNLYDMQTRELLYSVQTHSFNPASSESLAKEYGALIVKDIVKNKILDNQTPTLKAF